MAADVKSKYFVNRFPYLGKDYMHPAGQSLSEHVVLHLMEPLFNKGYNVTTDNFFHIPETSETVAGKENKSGGHNKPCTSRTATIRVGVTRLIHCG